MYIGVLLTFKKNLTMSIKFHVTKYLAVSALTMLLLGACSKNNIYIDVVDPDGEENMAIHPAMTVETTTAILPKKVP